MGLAVFAYPNGEDLVYFGPILGTKLSVPSPIESAVRKFGLYPRGGYTVINCHFHPPESILIPSPSDLHVLNRHNSSQRSKGKSILDVIALAGENEQISLLIMQQSDFDILKAMFNYLGDPKESTYPYNVFDRFRKRVIKNTFTRLFPDHPGVVEELAMYADGCLPSDFTTLARRLPPNYSQIFADELQNTGFYKTKF